MNAHTPGPWQITEMDGEVNRAVVGPDGELIADCFAPTAEDFNLPQDYEANARLIAAAPELLEALSHLLEMVSECQLNGILPDAKEWPAEKARAAIAKAKGQP